MIAGRAIVAGEAEGEALVTGESLSFWGGYDFKTGEIIDRHHPLRGVSAAGRILAVPFSKGSSTTTAVLLEAVRAGTAPAAILTTGVDSFLALASIVAGVMYGRSFPVVALETGDFDSLESGVRLAVEEVTEPGIESCCAPLRVPARPKACEAENEEQRQNSGVSLDLHCGLPPTRPVATNCERNRRDDVQ